MGGAAGHIPHLYEDHDLTIDGLVGLALDLALGKVSLYEKFDGINLLFRPTADGFRYARSATDVQNGGLRASEMESRFLKWPHVGKVVSEACHELDERLRLEHWPQWGSLEVVSGRTANVIKYDHDAIVIHPVDVRPIVRFEPDMLRIVDDVRTNGWSILGPKRIKANTDTRAVNTLRDRLALEASVYGLDTTAKLGDLHERRLALIVERDGIGQRSIVDAVVARLLHRPNAPTLREIKRRALHSDAERARVIVNDERAYLNLARARVAGFVHDFATKLFDGRSSVLVGDLLTCLCDIRNRWNDTIQSFRARGEMKKAGSIGRMLGSTDNINTSLEGAVLFHAQDDGTERCYKLVGSFALVNQVLGEERYGRPLKIDQI